MASSDAAENKSKENMSGMEQVKVEMVETPEPADGLKPKKHIPPVQWNLANPLNYLFFSFNGPLLKKAYYDIVDENDLLYKEDQKVPALAEAFKGRWQEELKRPKASLARALYRGNGATFVASGLLALIDNAATFIGPVLLNYIVEGLACRKYGDTTDSDSEYFQCEKPTKQRLLVYAGIMMAASLVFSVCNTHSLYMLENAGLKIRNSLMQAVYRKCLRLNNASLQSESTGKIVTIMSNDAQTIERFMPLVHLLWINPIVIVFTLYLLYDVVGWSTFCGLGSILLVMPAMAFLGMKQVKLRQQLVGFVDKRVGIMNELITGIRVIKFYAWEASFKKMVDVWRAKEVGVLTALAYVQAAFGLVLFWAPILVGIFSIGSFVLAGRELTAARAFTALALFNQLRFPMAFLPFLMSMYANCSVALGRIQGFLEQDELPEGGSKSPCDGPPGTVCVRGGTFEWAKQRKDEPEAEDKGKEEAEGKKEEKKEEAKDKKEEKKEEAEGKEEEKKEEAEEKSGPTLDDINFEIAAGTLTMVVGPVGSGKSSLVSTLLDDITKVQGDVQTKGTIAFVAQSAWILNATVHRNITLGAPFDQRRYDEAIRVSQLKADIEMLPNGDKTEIGERGVTLSGGQKQRVSIARAVYADADIYLLDDPLSAVDAHVSAALFDQCLCGALKTKTRLLVTNALQYLPQADQIIVLEEGRIKEIGSYAGLMAAGLDFAALVAEHTVTAEDGDEAGHEGAHPASPRKSLDKGRKSGDGRPSVDKAREPKDQPGGGGDDKNLSGVEHRAEGVVAKEVWMKYLAAAGGTGVAIFISIAFILDQGTKSFGDNWLAWWSENLFDRPTLWYLGLWVVIGLSNAIAVFVRSLSLTLTLKNAAKNLHAELLDGVMRFPTTFFDVTPSGRILNRFSKDTEVVDSELGGLILQFMGCLFNILCILAVVAVVNVWFLISLAPVTALYLSMQQYYIPTARTLQRIEATTRSPIYTTFSETLTGLVTIRAYAREDMFVAQSCDLMERNAAAKLTQRGANMWLNCRLDVIGMAVIGFAAFLAVTGKNPGLAGLALVYALQITRYLKHGTDMAAQIESKMNAVERITEYLDLPHEASWDTDSKVLAELPATWPDKGKLELQELCMRYRPELPLVLKGLSLSIEGGEKVGIVGRTGSGKSSLFLALFRLIEPVSGTVRIDGVDTSRVGLHKLRGNITMIPQDPFMFSGTIRRNLDPFDEHSNDALWRVVESVGLADTLRGDTSQGLDTAVSENGSNLSLGQRQLVCMARAVLHKSRLLMMDEATASIDLDTDQAIQRMVREQFAECTVLTIAHRLNTIMDSTRVLVMSDGRAAEFDTPANLLDVDPAAEPSAAVSDPGLTLPSAPKRKTSMFYELVAQTGKGNAEYLKSLTVKGTQSSEAVSDRTEVVGEGAADGEGR